MGEVKVLFGRVDQWMFDLIGANGATCLPVGGLFSGRLGFSVFFVVATCSRNDLLLALLVALVARCFVKLSLW